jgi:micrococcal nuclease
MGRAVRRRRLRTPVALVAIALLLATLARLFLSSRGDPPSSSAPVVDGTYIVKRVVDGDTLVLQDDTRIRLIGADTPETKRENWPVEPFGPEATQFTERFIAGKPVQLQFDGQLKDDFRRTLAYVYVDGKMLNEALLREGLARARTEFHYLESMKELFRRAETEARRNRRGIWSR